MLPGYADTALEQKLYLTERSNTSHHFTIHEPSQSFVPVVCCPSGHAKPRVLWSLSPIPSPIPNPHLVLPLQDTCHFRPDIYGGRLRCVYGALVDAVFTTGIIRNYHKRDSCGANVPL